MRHPKLPPYGKALAQSIADQNPPINDVYLFMGSWAWQKAQNSILMRPDRTLCLPKGASPFSYLWPVSGCDILIFDSDPPNEDLIEDLVAILFHHGASIVRYVSHDGTLSIFNFNF